MVCTKDARKVAEGGDFDINGRLVKTKWKSEEKCRVQVDGLAADESNLKRMKLYFGNPRRGGPIEDITKRGDSIIIEFKDEQGVYE